MLTSQEDCGGAPGIHCCAWYDDVNTVCAAVLSIVNAIMAAWMEGFDRSISYAFPCFGCATMTLKLEQRASVKSIYEGKDRLFLWLPTGFGKAKQNYLLVSQAKLVISFSLP